MENNNQELNNVETIDFDDNNQPTNMAPEVPVVNNVESTPIVDPNLVNIPPVEQPIVNTVVNEQLDTTINNDIPVDDINTSIPSESTNNPQAQALDEIQPKKQEQIETKEAKKNKSNSLLPLILLFGFLMAFILLLPTISELLTGI